MDVADSCSLPGCYLLVVVGEPYSEDHKKQILQKISKGLLSWDTKTTGCDLSELENVCNNVKHGSDTENELLIQHSTETLAVEVLINPQVSTLKQCLKNLLLARTGHKHLIYAGYSFTGTGSWILQNGTFKFTNFIDAFQDADVQKELQNNQGGTFHVHCTEEGEWTSANFQKQAIQKLIKLELNPSDKIDSLPGMPALIQCLDSALVSHTLEEIMTLSPLVGNIRFNRPTLYVFPGGEGDCALFGINGFNMLVDGGFNRKPCFWEFIRHLDRLDAVMVTRLCESNVCGITTLMKRKAINNIYPQIGYVFCNVMEGKPTPNDEITKDKNDLSVSVLNEGHTFLNNLMELNMKPHRCLRDVTNMDPFTLYQKVGHGTLEMYTLSPQKDSKEVKEFLQQWASRKETFSKVKTGVKYQDQEISIPLSHVLSICSLVVWRPANPKDTITRIFFSGSAPQNKIFEGLEKLKDLDVLKKPVCSYSSLHPTTVEKPKSKLLSKGPSIKTSPLVTNGTGRSTESLGSKKEVTTTDIESKKETIEKRTSKTPVKKDPYKSVIETKEKKETRKSTTTNLTSTATKKEVKEKKTPVKPPETKKTSPIPKVSEVKSKGLKEVTNKKTVETKTAKKKPELVKQKSPPTTETHKPKPVPKSQPPAKTKTLSKTTKADVSKHTPKTEVKKIISKVSASTTAKKDTPTEKKEPVKVPKPIKVDKPAEIPVQAEISEEKVVEAVPPSPKDTEIEDKEIENIAPEPVKELVSPVEKENIEPVQKIEETRKEEIEEKVPEEPAILSNENFTTETVAVVEEQSKTDLLLANASMEGSFCEGLMEEVQEPVKEESYIQSESTNLETSPYHEEKVQVEEVIEEKSEKESLHDVMALENNEDYEILEEKVEKEDKLSEHETESKPVTIKHEEMPVEENDSISDKELPISKNNLFVDVESYKQIEDDEDTVKSPTPMAVVDYEDEGVALEVEREKCEEDLPENDKGLKDEAFENYKIKYQDDVLEMDKSDDREEKESSSLSEEDKLEEEEEMIRHPTPPGERNFYEKIGAIPDDRMEELDSRFMEHYLPRQPEAGFQQLYEGEEEDDESDSEGPIVEQPVYGNVIQADFPEFVNISGGTTPSEPQSPKAMYDSKQKFSDVSEQLLKDTPPQEIDEDRFEEEQKTTSDYSLSPSKSLENKEILGGGYNEFGKSLHEEEKILKDRDDKIVEEEEEEEEEETSLQEKFIQNNVIQEEKFQEETLFAKTIPEEEITQEAAQDEELMPEKAMQEDLIQEKIMKEELMQENVLKEQGLFEEVPDQLKEQTDSFKEQNRSPCKDVYEDCESPLQEYEIKNLQEPMTEQIDSFKEEERLSPCKNLYNDRESPLQEYDSKNLQDPMQEKADSFKEQESLSPCKDMYDDRESPLQEYDDKSLPESMQEHPDSFKEEKTLSPCRDIYKDQESPLQEHDSIFTYHDQKIQEEDKHVLSSDTKIEETLDYDKDIHQEQEKLFFEQDEPATRDIYSSETTMEYQEKQIYSDISKPEENFNVDNKQLSDDDDLDSQEQLRPFQHETEATTGHYEITSSSMFNSHPMDQSFHESYAEAETKEDEDFGTYIDEKSDKLHDPYDSYIIDKEKSRFDSESKEEHMEDIPASNINGKYFEEKHETTAATTITTTTTTTATSHYFESGETRFDNYESYNKEAHRAFAEVTEEGYYGDNERSNIENDHSNNLTRYTFQSTETAEGDTVISERKEFTYSTTTNGVSLPSDINGHKMEPWKDNSLLGFEADSYRNEAHDSASYYKRDYSDTYGTDNHTVPTSSELFKSDVGQRHYSETTSINDIYLDSKDPKEIVEKETFSSMSFGYMKNDYHPEDKDDLLEHQYSEHVQKDSSKDFRLEDWSKPMGLPSPPETKTTKTSTTTRLSLGKSKIEKSSTSSTENVKMKMASRMDKSSKMKTNASSVTPVFVDLAYVPHHGDPHYSNYEFFMRIRARYYVFSGINPSKEVLNSLLEAKKSWKDDSEVTIIPTYETDTLGYWMALNQDTLIENKIDVAPSASRCTVNLQDHETSCAAYRLEF